MISAMRKQNAYHLLVAPSSRPCFFAPGPAPAAFAPCTGSSSPRHSLGVLVMHILQRLRIGPRLFLAFGILGLFMVAISLFAINRMGDIAQAVSFQNTVRTHKLEPLYAAREALDQTGLSARNALAIADNAEAGRELDKVDSYKALYLAEMLKAAPYFKDNAEFAKVD